VDQLGFEPRTSRFTDDNQTHSARTEFLKGEHKGVDSFAFRGATVFETVWFDNENYVGSPISKPYNQSIRSFKVLSQNLFEIGETVNSAAIVAENREMSNELLQLVLFLASFVLVAQAKGTIAPMLTLFFALLGLVQTRHNESS
jgi:hypothetical protein